MDLVTLKKKLSTYESDKGYLKNVGDDVLYEVLVAWENWTGASKDFYRALGFTHRQMAGLIRKFALNVIKTFKGKLSVPLTHIKSVANPEFLTSMLIGSRFTQLEST